jgi:tRNA pseudouridine55 synthase
MDRIFAAYKPLGMTSHDVVARIRRELPRGVKVGHAGTLDPLAEGVLVIAIGNATKRIATEVAKEKEYIATIKLGAESTTDDDEGEKTIHADAVAPTEEAIRTALHAFIGTVEQVPPVYSAVKLSGTAAYALARKGHDVELKPREVRIDGIEILEYEWPILTLKITTGPGVYIRAIARDLGRALHTGGYLIHLLRTRVGEYTSDEAVKLEDITSAIRWYTADSGSL